MPVLAPSFVASAVAIIVNLQSVVGLSFTSSEWTAAITVVCGIVVVVRQVVTGRSTLWGGRPK